MFLAERRNQLFQPKRSYYFWKTIKTLEANDCITIKDGKRKEFKLTTFGQCMASIILKHPKGNEKLRKYAYTVEFWLL
jgi:hypothetical protein